MTRHSPALLAACEAAVDRLARVWPAVSRARQVWVEEYADALDGLPVEAIPVGVRRYLREGKWKPTPSELRAAVVAALREANGERHGGVADPDFEAQRSGYLRQAAGMDKLMRWLIGKVGLQGGIEVVALAVQHGAPDEVTALREGRAPESMIRAALGRWRAGERPRTPGAKGWKTLTMEGA